MKLLAKTRPLKTPAMIIGALLVGVIGTWLVMRSFATSTPTLGIYRGAAGTSNTGPSGINQVSTWLGRDVSLGEDFNADAAWSDIEGASWQLGPWGQWVSAKSGRALAFAVSPFPKTGGSLAECAAGAYNSHFQKLGQNLVANKLGNTYLRFGHEMNGTFYSWSAVGKESDFKSCFQQFTNTMRATAGNSFKTVWNPNGGGYYGGDLSTMYPGDAYVDYIGADVYDQSWATSTYPYPSPCDDACKLTHQQNAWSSVMNSSGAGLNWFVSFAKQHGKQLTIPEWGLLNRPDGHGGLDNPYYVQQMSDFINNANNNVAWHVFFDFTSADGARQISPVPSTYVTTVPNGAAKFKLLFAPMAAVPTADTSIPTAAITVPVAGATLSGSVPVQATATDNVAVAKVEFYLDGALAKTENAAPYCLGGDNTTSTCAGWDTKSVSNATHTIYAKSYDAAGNVGTSQSVTFTVRNQTTVTTPDSIPPVAVLNAPIDGSQIRGQATITASASDNIAIASLEVLVDGKVMASTTAEQLSFSWNTRGKKVTTGSHTITVRAKDTAGLISNTTATVMVTK